MAQPIPRQRSFISTLTTKSEIMVRGCCNRQILEDDIIYNIVGGVRVLVLSCHTHGNLPLQAVVLDWIDDVHFRKFIP